MERTRGHRTKYWGGMDGPVNPMSPDRAIRRRSSVAAALVGLALLAGADAAPPAATATVAEYDDEPTFLAATGAGVRVDYPAVASGGDGTAYTENGVSLRRNHAGQTTGWAVSDRTPHHPGNEFAVSGAEHVDVQLPAPVKVFGIRLVDRNEGDPTCPPSDSRFEVTLRSAGVVVHTTTIDPPADAPGFFGVTSDEAFDRVEFRETPAACENDLFGDIFTDLDNEPPHAAVEPPHQVRECTGGAADATLSASPSFDPEGGALTYAWSAPGGVAFSPPDGVTTSATFPLGTTTVALQVTDPPGLTDTASASVTVVDTVAPTVRVERPEDGDLFVGDTRIAEDMPATAAVGPLTVTADAQDECGVDRVEFLASTGQAATDASSPYAFLLVQPFPFAGRVTVTATAYDASGNGAGDAVTFLQVATP